MAWLVAGAAEYARIGLAEPDGVRRATADYEASTDTVAQFVEARLLIGGGEAVKARSADVRAAYEHWCRVEGETPIPPKALTTRLTSGYPVTTFKGTGGVRFLTGITLVNEPADDNRGVQFEPAHAPLDAPLPQSLPTQGELL
jgi:phage/plasmid-associated DNA primase